jgi:hypothetical protein
MVFKTGTTVVDRKTGQKFKVEDSDLDLDPNQYNSFEEPAKEFSDKAAADLSRAQADPKASLMSSAEAIEQKARSGSPVVTSQPPRFPNAEQVVERYAGPAATAATGFIPGSLAIQSGIGAVTEAVGQKLAGKELDPVSIGVAAATPPSVRAAGAVLKPIARGAAKVFGGENLIKGGIQKIESFLGKKAADKASDAGLAAAKSLEVPAAQTETGRVVTDILSKKGRIAGTNDDAIRISEEVVRNTAAAAKAGNPIRYNEVFEQAKNMSGLASKAKGADKEHFIRLRNAMLSDLAGISPEAGEAIKSYRKSASIKDITESLNLPNPARHVRDMLDDPLVKGVFNETEQKVIETVSKQIGNAGLLKIGGSLASVGAIGATSPIAGGLAISPALIMGALVAAPKVGPVLARSLLGPEGKINAAAVPALAQLVRGYMATQEANE